MNKKTKSIKVKIVNLNTGLNTMKVQQELKIRHSKYEKLVKRYKKFLIAVNENVKTEYQVGDEVRIVPCAPVSKNKTWELVSKKTKKTETKSKK